MFIIAIASDKAGRLIADLSSADKILFIDLDTGAVGSEPNPLRTGGAGGLEDLLERYPAIVLFCRSVDSVVREFIEESGVKVVVADIASVEELLNTYIGNALS